MENLQDQLQRFLAFYKTRKVSLVGPFCFFPDFAVSVFALFYKFLVVNDEILFHCTFLQLKGPYLSSIKLGTFLKAVSCKDRRPISFLKSRKFEKIN